MWSLMGIPWDFKNFDSCCIAIEKYYSKIGSD